MSIKKVCATLNVLLLSFSVLSGFILLSSDATAYTCWRSDNGTCDIYQYVSLSVPASCNLTGTGMDSHVATINPGTHNSAIGETVLKASCNDVEGFAIYAIGYTNGVAGSNVLSNNSLGPSYDIFTGTSISGDTSNWAMKLATVTSPTPTYPITIENNFDSFHTVPSEYTLVAKRLSGTDVGVAATGSTLTTTYQAYISPTQATGTYRGKVRYALVHPNYADNSVPENNVTVVFDGNGLTFPNGSTTNTVTYAKVCQKAEYYIDYSNYQEVMTSNITTGGVQDGPYTNEEESYDNVITISGADKLKIEVNYGVTAGSIDLELISDNNYISFPKQNLSGTKTYIFDGDTVNINIVSWAEPVANYDYGFYIKVYPVYETEQPNTTAEELLTNNCSLIELSGYYIEPDGMISSKWYFYDYLLQPECDAEVGGCEPIEETLGELFDAYDLWYEDTITLYARNPNYRINYNGNNATAGTMEGFYNSPEEPYDYFDLLAPNFYKTGYGFAGWSQEPNATVNSNSKIYGPNEAIRLDDLGIAFGPIHETTLYAVWVPSTGTMQNWSGCSSMNQGQVIALTDNRDNNVYTVGKLADDNCWMMENLRLDAENSTDSSKAQGFGGVFVGLADSEDEYFNAFTTANSIYNTSIITGTYQSYRFPRYNNNNTNIGGTNSVGVPLVASPTDNSYNNHGQWYSYGNYYNWPAAMANTDTLNNSSASESAGTSICPTGWSLPYGGNSGNGALKGGFSYLDVKLGGSGRTVNGSLTRARRRWSKYPNNFVKSGNYRYSSSTNYGSIDRDKAWAYQTRTASSYGVAYLASFDNYNFYPGNYSGDIKTSGASVRCLTQ